MGWGGPRVRFGGAVTKVVGGVALGEEERARMGIDGGVPSLVGWKGEGVAGGGKIVASKGGREWSWTVGICVEEGGEDDPSEEAGFQEYVLGLPEGGSGCASIYRLDLF